VYLLQSWLKESLTAGSFCSEQLHLFGRVNRFSAPDRKPKLLTTGYSSMKPDLIKQLGGNDASGQVVLHNTPSEFKAEQPTTKFIRTSKLDCSMDIDGPNKTTYDCRWLQ
jgi:hypothetical protein